MGVLYELQQKNPDKKFYSVGHRQYCPNMKKISPEKVRNVLMTGENEVVLEETMRVRAKEPLVRMLQLAR